jgi:hypothetical protein
MAICKLTSSGKGVNFIDDDGNVYITSLTYLRSYLNSTKPFIVLARLPEKVSSNRFPKSPVFNPETGETSMENKIKVNEDERVSQDSFSPAADKAKQIEKDYSKDKLVW